MKCPQCGHSWEPLTPREKDIMELIVEGLSNKEIAAKLGLSPGTVRTHTSNILAKYNVPSRLKLALVVLKNA